MLCSLIIISLSFCSLTNSLSLNYYHKTCSNVESIVAQVVKDAVSKDTTVPAALLRLHFHDCFIRVSISTNWIIYCDWFFQFLCIWWWLIKIKIEKGLWRFCVAGVERWEQSGKGWTAECVSARIFCDRKCKESSWSCLPSHCLLCWYLGLGC